MLLKDRISPVRNPYLSFPAWPADSYPVREVCRPPGTVQRGALQGPGGRKLRVLQDAPGVSISSYHTVVQTRLQVRSAGCAAQPPLWKEEGGEKAAHFLCLFSA
ncbi:hypothetical protein VZT92_010007 [Zoarces viviparus]|uniref:Uncharacterized protein n=1 Tax=Zoarces viviparus TaxID=48416 RepID=A0AAW1FE43_ZOAVI